MADCWSIYLGQGEAVLSDPDGKNIHFCQDVSPLAGFERCAALVNATRKGWRRHRVQLLMSTALARPYLVGPVSGIRTWVEARALAEAMAATNGGMSGSARVRLDTWPARKGSLAIAAEDGFLLELEAAAKGAGLNLTAVIPWWLPLFSKTGERKLLVLQEPGNVALIAGDFPHCDRVDVIVPCPSDEALRSLVARAELALNLKSGAAAWHVAPHSEQSPSVRQARTGSP